jgi:hypothetical protein
MFLRSEDNKKVLPHALPLFSTDTKEEAESLIILFGTKPCKGPLKGRYICSQINREGTIAGISAVAEQMHEQYLRMKERNNDSNNT